MVFEIFKDNVIGYYSENARACFCMTKTVTFHMRGNISFHLRSTTTTTFPRCLLALLLEVWASWAGP